MSKKWTPEPWPDADSRILRLSQADYDHAKDCVDALAGINPEAVPELIELAKHMVNSGGWASDLHMLAVDVLAKAERVDHE